MPTDEGEVVEGAAKKKLKTKQRWSIMFLARAADTEAVTTAKQEKMQVGFNWFANQVVFLPGQGRIKLWQLIRKISLHYKHLHCQRMSLISK